MTFFYKFWKKSSSLLHLKHFWGGAQAPRPPLDSPLNITSLFFFIVHRDTASYAVSPKRVNGKIFLDFLNISSYKSIKSYTPSIPTTPQQSPPPPLPLPQPKRHNLIMYHVRHLPVMLCRMLK